METEQIKLKRQKIVEQFGDWTAHNILLKDDTFTYDQSHPKFEEQLTGHGIHLRRILQIVSDTTNQPLSKLRVLDLACLEGLYGIEFARHGSEVIGIEGREANVVKAQFAKDVLELNNLTFVQDDVRNLSVSKYGHFDVVLCLGILYHLDVPDVFHFVESMSEVCRGVAVIDTHVGIKSNRTHVYEQQEYHGRVFNEHIPGDTEEEKLKRLWSSLDNENSFWFTRPSLFNLLAYAGFTSAYTCQNPAVPGQWLDRDTIVAIKGQKQNLRSAPSINDRAKELWPEESQVGLYPTQQVHTEPTPQLQSEAPGALGKVRLLIKRVLG
jgi:2-polyprenyl-3-methyl-5-hydroxy-6-metoxy-1,4-benzoquinol methylase